MQQFAEEDEIRAPLEYGWGGKRVMGGSELGGGGGGRGGGLGGSRDEKIQNSTPLENRPGQHIVTILEN